MRYTLSCYGPSAYVFSIPLRTSAAWLRRVLKRKNIINAEALTEAQFHLLKSKLPEATEAGWAAHLKLEYYVEGRPTAKPKAS